MIDKARYFEVAVLGGGASGIVAAISAKRGGSSVVICERMPRLGKKILASGNGRCNLLNEELSESFYNPASRSLVKSIFAKFGKSEILNLFKGLGLQTYSEGARIFPFTNQSSSVLKVLEIELKHLAIPVEYDFEAKDVTDTKKGFLISSKSGRHILCGALVMAAGGRSYPSLGSDGSCYKFAEAFGHRIIDPVPCAVPLSAKDVLCHILQGQKIFASAKAIINGKAGVEVSGDILFTKYGLSGTAILDISRDLSIAINRTHKNSVAVIVDMVPFMDEARLKAELEDRLKRGIPGEELITGILPNKFGPALEVILKTKDAGLIAKRLKAKEFNIIGTRGWNEADFTAGGVDTAEVNEMTLESKIKKGFYLSGEILDVDGCRGGYNLAWAWASGFVAGLAAAGASI